MTNCCSCFGRSDNTRPRSDSTRPSSISSTNNHQMSKPTSADFKGQPRLPTFAVPKRYDIQLRPDLGASKFEGTVSINLDIVADTRFIVLNAAHLSIKSDSVSFSRPNSNMEFEKPNVGMVEADEILVLDFPETLPKGMGVLTIGFAGVLNDKMKGFYRSTYDHNGEKKNMAVTQFEPADARQCFPCWDEPAFKAKFKITLLDVPSELVALSNMPVDKEIKLNNGNLKSVYYQESPVMSTYLVAVVIGLFDYIEDHTSDGIKVRVYSQVGKANQGKFALHVALQTLGFYKDYFHMPYPLPKLDMVAIPDFAAGGMENYGLVTYNDTNLLLDAQHSAAANKQRVATVVAHELAHQWFGNLVTMEWWTDLWLKEGFATWTSYLAKDKLFPEWKIWTQFSDHESSEGLRLDGLAESHPIEVEVNHVSEIDEIFDSISYKKGASIIRMLQGYVGGSYFQNSLATYIKRHANARTNDLWAVLKEGCSEPVDKIMNSWTKQKGYPVLSVRMRNQTLEIKQSQFLYNGSHGDGQWIIPITYCCGDYNSSKSLLMEKKSETHDISGLISENSDPARSWIKLNVEQIGFFRVKYDDGLAAKLRYAIENKCLSVTDRLGILDDSFALCMARQMSLTSLLNFMAAYREELEHTVLSNLIKIVDKVGRIVADARPELMNYIKQFFIGLLLHSAAKLGWDPKQGESHLDAMSRGDVFTALAMLGHEETINEVISRFHAFLNDPNTPLLHPDIRKAAYVAVMQKVSSSNKESFESLLRIYRETDLSQEKNRVLGSLASCPDQGMIFEALNFALSPEVRRQNAVFGLAVCKEGRDIAWKWLMDNWDHIWTTYGSGYLLTRFVSSIVSPFASSDKVKEIEKFFANRTQASITRTLKQSIEQIQINAKWVQSIRNEKGLAEAFKKLAITGK